MVETTTHSEVPGEHAEPSAFGLVAPGIVALAMVVVLIILIWKKVPSAIGKGLDAKIAAEERAAVDELRATTARAASAAAAKLIAERNDASSDAKLVDQAIAGL
jgi:F-type H+-transporting ATPase subunit b